MHVNSFRLVDEPIHNGTSKYWLPPGLARAADYNVSDSMRAGEVEDGLDDVLCFEFYDFSS